MTLFRVATDHNNTTPHLTTQHITQQVHLDNFFLHEASNSPANEGPKPAHSGPQGKCFRHRELSGRVIIVIALEEPVQWRGGNMVFFPKKDSSNHSCDAQREIAVSSVPGKLLHRWRRALGMPGFLDIAAETQCGCLAGRATDVASHLLRQTVEHHKARKRFTIVVFVDVIAAFYNVVRSLVTDISPLLQDARVMDDHVLNSVTAQLVATWFSIVGSDTVSKLRRGVMPGDPEADQQFTLVISMLLNTLRTQLAIEGIEASVPHVPPDEAILSARRAALVTWNPDVSYVDDIAIAIPVHADQAINTL